MEEEESEYEGSSSDEDECDMTTPERKAKQREHNGRVIKEEKVKKEVKSQQAGEYRYHVQQEHMGANWEKELTAQPSDATGQSYLQSKLSLCSAT